MWNSWCWIMVTVNMVVGLSSVVKIGAIFTEEARGGSAELAFKYAVYRINKERTVLPESTLIQSGAIAIFSSAGPLLGGSLSAMCDSLHAPHFTVDSTYSARELNIGDLARDGRDMYAVRCESRDYRRALAQLKMQRVRHIMVDVDPKHLRQLARADMALFDLEDFYYNRVNMSGWRLVDRGSDKVEDALQVQAHGLTGPIEFTNGVRTTFNLQLMRLMGGEDGGTVMSGTWSPTEGLEVTDPAAYRRDPPPNVTLTVVTVEKADIAVASMTINYAREAVIDFTKPFMNLGIGILFKVSSLTNFLNPLAIEIWLYVLAAYILVSFTLFVMARFSPYEWSSSTHVCGHETKMLTNQFNVCNSIWFITGTFLRQGSGLNPKSAADLAAQTSVQYGTLNGGSTMTFFRDSNIDIYQTMWRHMSTASPPALVSSYEEGVRRVLGGNYAFLMESTMLDHRVQRDCNLTQIGGLLDSKGYGIATLKGSPWRDRISLAILELQEKGVIQILYDKWWKNTGDVCNRDGKDSKANPLGVQNIGGVFVTLLCGLVLAIVVAILEFCWHTRKNASQGQSLCSEMGQELRTAMRGGSSRTILKAGCSRCSPATHVPSRYEIVRTRYSSLTHIEHLVPRVCCGTDLQSQTPVSLPEVTKPVKNST
ncbi:unnamed protein product [Leptidea sinapis]|uniref:Ionotropic glutamate receptor C-terminal domain-containing protein n=1 Tax=Leptidea sinapis TaxID=189913 RepID=A0A5E4PNB0_9NEOP|nr:unnamed protein product [Leptidea sinapis]